MKKTINNLRKEEIHRSIKLIKGVHIKWFI